MPSANRGALRAGIVRATLHGTTSIAFYEIKAGGQPFLLGCVSCAGPSKSRNGATKAGGHLLMEKTADSEVPATCTRSARDYFSAGEKGLALFHFLVTRVVHADHVAYIAKRALAGEEWSVNEAELLKNDPGKNVGALRQMRQEFLELFFENAVNNFDTYIVSILREVLRKRPEILRTREQNVSVEYVLQFHSIQELTNDLVEGKVNSLSFEGFKALQAWCSKRDIPLAVPEDMSDTIVELIATRNCIVHNRGLIDDKYLRTVRNPKFRKDQKRNIEISDFEEAVQMLNRVVLATDKGVASKFGLECLEAALDRGSGEV